MARRWRGKNAYRKGTPYSTKGLKQGDGITGNSNGTVDAMAATAGTAEIWMHRTTRRDLVNYLVQFRTLSLELYQQDVQSKLEQQQEELCKKESKETATTAKSSWFVLRLLDSLWVASSTNVKKANPTMTIVDKSEYYMIGGIIFPPLTAATCRQRYVTLPSLLSSKQRRLVHACCVEADVFHESYDKEDGSNNNSNSSSATAGTTTGTVDKTRVVVISCYADGFDGIPELQQQIQRVRSTHDAAGLHHYKPWFCRAKDSSSPIASQENDFVNPDALTPTKSNSTIAPASLSQSRDKVQAEALAVAAIFKLIDQPGRCLRDDRDTLVYDTWRSASLDSIEPPNDNDSAWMLVDSADKMKQCIQELQSVKPSELAFDIEAYNPSKYAQLTCLLQLATDDGREYVIDTLAPGVWDLVPGLAPLFADPSIVKVGHSIGGLDVRCLHRDFGCFVVNVFDTYEASKLLGLPSQGLAAVCAHYGLRQSEVYVTLKETYQRCDWRQRPLTEPMIRYGRYDVHYLLQLRWLLMRDMVQASSDGGWENVADDVAQIDLDFINMIDQAQDNDNSNGIVGTTPPSTKSRGGDIFDFMSADLKTSRYEDDDETFKTPRQRAKSDEDMFHTPSSSIRNMSVIDDDDNLGAGGLGMIIGDMTAAKLRLQPVLMSCLSVSQERCRDLWTSKSEPHMTNELLVSLVKRTKQGEVDWKASNTNLYNALVDWRQQTALKLECLPGFVASLDFLVAVAWKRPMTESGLRRISYQLPAVLEQQGDYRLQLLDLVLQKTVQDGISIETGTMYYYDNSADRHAARNSILDVQSNVNRSVTADQLSVEDVAFKLFVAGTIGFGIVMAVMDARKRRGR